ncbi:MAG: GDP-mannose 4,6-dehydratase [Sedimentisphaerales bacterium]|nr:GDP-mannose 4,6-dehydratase [Sedimentisphaerales bacterium]
MRSLITGVTGFVGSHLAEYILENHTEVEVAGFVRWRSPKDNIEGILNKISLYYGNLQDFPSVRNMLASYKPDVIFHLAAQSYVDFSFLAPIETLETNIVGTCNLLEAVKQLKQSDSYNPVIHVCSSSEVYGQVTKDEIPIKESNTLRPASPYAVSKVGEDMLALQYWSSWEIKTIRSRMFTHTGPRRGEVFVVSNFAKQIAMIEAGLAEPTVKVGNLNSVRTFSDVRDAVRAYWLLVNKCSPGDVYNIGGVETLTIGQMLDKLLELSTAKNIKVEVDPTRLRPSDVTLQIPCIDKFQNATNWKPEISFEKTLIDTLEYWRNFYKKNK